jgi:hypothetical protein
MTFEFKKGFDNDLFGRLPDHVGPARAINDHVGRVVVLSYGAGIFSFLKIVDEKAWDEHVAPRIRRSTDNYLQLTIPEDK